MIYLINIILFLLINFTANANENNINEILFKINNKVFTNIDLEQRTEYVALLNNFSASEFSVTENNEILNDYISSLIFYEYYIQNRIIYKNIKDEIELLYKKNLKDNAQLNKAEIKNFKFNIFLDLIRNKIIEEKLNSRKDTLLKEVSTLDLLYNYNLQYIIIKENLIDQELIKNIKSRNKFNELKKNLKENKINFFFKNQDIDDKNMVSNDIQDIISKNLTFYTNNKNGYITIISIKKNLESYEGIFVKLINFKSSIPFEKNDLQCDKLNEIIDINKTVFKEYEYSKLNDKIKNNLKSINDYILINDNNEYNYIVLCDLTYDENLLKNINFNKNVNYLVDKIQNNFLKKYKNEYNFSKIK